MRSDGIWGNIFKQEQDKESLTATLKNVSLFRELSAKELRILETLVHVRTYEPNETVFAESEPGAGMYIIRKGLIAITVKHESVEPILLAELEPGDFFGEMALLGDTARSATATAREESELIGFFHPELMEIINLHPAMSAKISFGLAKTLADRLRYTNVQLRERWGMNARTE